MLGPDVLLVDLSAADVVATVDELDGEMAWLVLLFQKLNLLEVFGLGQQLGLLN